MSEDIFLLRGEDELIPMTETPYDSEDVLQALLAKFPALLAGDQLAGGDARQWLLIDRESAVPDSEEGSGRWSVDHLFLDQDAVPTLVEVKRSSDTRIRREVVGQLLDYAANAVVYWPADSLRDAFESRVEREGLEADSGLAEIIGSGADVDSYWEQAAANLRAGRIRLVFVADEIPRELRRVVEFLNEQMAADVIAIEVRQYVGPDGLRTLVPRLIGQTAAAETRKQTGQQRHWDEASLLSAIEADQGSAEAEVVSELIEWARRQGLRFSWGTSTRGQWTPVLDYGGHQYYPFWVASSRKIQILFQWLVGPPFDDVEVRHELRRRLNEIPGISIPPDSITGRPSIPLATLASNPEALKSLEQVFEWCFEAARSETS